MDLGMTTKVQRVQCRSLEDFAHDARLVTSNAKILNFPGSIYYTKADRLEVCRLDQIVKASSTMHRPPSVSLHAGSHPAMLRRRHRGPSNNLAKENSGGAVSESISAEGRLQARKIGSLKASAFLHFTCRCLYKLVRAQKADKLTSSQAMSKKRQVRKIIIFFRKRYKPKKERMRVEKEGPPYIFNGCLACIRIISTFILSVPELARSAKIR
ncbi:hypothetical protein B0H11DRAFT_1944224 [Mycena galericulata]|nr:hypothetical protein B0H11DRAFT_1944224 [Mycena galericulata]